MSKKSMNAKKVNFELIPLREVTLEDFPNFIGVGVKALDLATTKWVCHYNLSGSVSGHLFVSDWTDVMVDIRCKPYKVWGKVKAEEVNLEEEYFVSTYKEAKEAIYKVKKFLAKYVDDPRLKKFE